jgi:hypothetical protein
MTGLLALVASIGLAVQPAPQGSVRGQVRAAGEEGPLASAVIRIVDLDRLTITDERGYYLLDDVPAGEHRIHASIIGFSSLEVVLSVPESGHLSVDFILTLQPVELPPVTAQGVPEGARDPPSLTSELIPATGTAVVRLLDASPGVSETGIAATAMALLSSSPPSPDNILFVRGSGTALDFVLMDGAPVHSPMQLGGLLDPGLPPTVAIATRWHGGAPARFDGGLSEVLSLESLGSPEGPATAAAFVDLVSAGMTFRTGGGPARGSFSARSLHGGGSGAFIEGAFPQRYADVLARMDVGISPTDTLTVSGFWNRESVALPNAGSSDHAPEWGNTAGSIRYRGRLEVGLLEVGVSSGEFRNRLPIGAVDPVLASGTTKRTRVTMDVLGDRRRVRYGFGIHLDRLAMSTVFAEGPASERLAFEQDNSAVALAGYFDAGLRVARGLRLSAGVRGNLYSGRLGQALSPRVRLEWNASESLLMTVSAGQYHQLVVTPDTSASASAALLASTEAQQIGAVFTTISPAEASHLVVGFSHSAGPGEQFGLQGYWKTSRGLPVLGGADLQNAGFDVWLTQPAGRVVLWSNYSMAWAWTELVQDERTNIFSGRHFLRAGVMADLGRGVRFDADISFGAGLEFGEIPRPGPANLSVVPGSAPGGDSPRPSFSAVPGVGPIPIPAILVTVPEGSYLRLNLRATARLDSHLFGRRTSFYPYIRVINVLDRADAMFYQFEKATDQVPRAFGAVPILPIIGVEWRM